jgi:integrase
MAKRALAPGEVGTVQVTAYDKDGGKDATGKAIAYYIGRTRYGAIDGGRPVRVQARAKWRRDAEYAAKKKASEMYAAEVAKLEAKEADKSIPRTWDGYARRFAAWVTSDDSDYSDATVRVYSGALRNHFLGAGHQFAGRELADLSRDELREWLQGIANDHGDGAAHTVQSLAGTMFTRAADARLLDGPGPLYGLKPVKRSRKKSAQKKAAAAKDAEKRGKALRERDTDKAFTVEDQGRIRAFIAADKRTNDNDTADLIRLMLGTGLRIGEALALRWEDVHLRGKSPYIAVTGTLGRVAGEGIVRQGWAKTEAGDDRQVYIGSECVELLRERYARMTKVGHESPLPMSEDGAVFPSVNGTWRDQSNVNRQIRYVFDHEDVGVPWATSHTMRKTVVTDLIAAGLPPNAVAAHVGHADASFTLRTYADSVTAPKDAGTMLELARAAQKKPTIEPTGTDRKHLRVVS